MSESPKVGLEFLGRLRQLWSVFYNRKASVWSKFNTRRQRLLPAAVRYRQMYLGLAANRRDFGMTTTAMSRVDNLGPLLPWAQGLHVQESLFSMAAGQRQINFNIARMRRITTGSWWVAEGTINSGDTGVS